MGVEKIRRPIIAPSYATLDGAAIGGAAGNWWDQLRAHLVAKTLYSDGLAYSVGKAPSLVGFADDAASAGAGLIPGDDTISGNLIHKLAPVVNTTAAIQLISTSIPWAAGHYLFAQVRFTNKDLITNFHGFADTAMVHAPANTAGGLMFFKRSASANWEIGYGPGDGATAWAYIDTGVVFDETALVNLELYTYKVGAVMYAKCWINGELVATITADLPAPTDVTMRVYQGSIPFTAFPTTTEDQGQFVNQIRWMSESQGVPETAGFASL